MNKVKDAFLRFGPLVAAALLGLNGVFPNLDGLFGQLVGVFSLLGATADAEFVQLVGEGAAGAVALLGVVRKGISIVQKKLDADAA